MPRRLKWGTIQYLEQLAREYFETHPIPTIAGICLHLGIRSDTWKYYVAESWRSKYSPEEYEKFRDERDENSIFQDMIEISPNTYVIGDGNSQSIDDDSVKAAVSSIFQMAKQKIDAYVSEEIFKSRNPAGPIYYSKAALGYREADSEQSNAVQMPTKITINILPQPQKAGEIKLLEIDRDDNGSGVK